MGKRRTELRQEVVQMLGGKCQWCGNPDPRVLHVDHKYMSPRDEKANIGNQETVFRLIVDGLISKDVYQILCANCNWIKKVENNEN